jgi:hypothetical protein
MHTPIVRILPGGGCLWIDPQTGFALRALAVCADGVERRVSFLCKGEPYTWGAWMGTIRIGTKRIRGTVAVSEADPDAPTLRFWHDPDMVAERSPRYDSPFRMVRRSFDCEDGIDGHTEVEILPKGGPGSLRAKEGTRLWVETPTAEAEGIDPYAD